MRKLAWLLAGVTACAGAPPPVPLQAVVPELKYNLRDFPLASGLRVLVQEDHATPLVAVVSVYGVGSLADPEGEEGLAHLVEHLSFRARSDSGTVGERLRRLGATINAQTGPEATAYYALAHRDHLGALLDIERQRLARTLDGITPEILEVEREVVRHERSQKGDSSALVALVDLAFPAGHPLRRDLVGHAAPGARLSLPAAERLVREHYRPENATIVIAGDVDPDWVARALARWPPELIFGPEGPRGPARAHRFPARTQAPSPGPPASTAIVHRRGSGSRRLLLVGWAAPDSAFLDAAALGLLHRKIIREFHDQVFARLAWAVPRLLVSRHGSLFYVAVELGENEDPREKRDLVVSAVSGSVNRVSARRAVSWSKWAIGTTLLRESTDLLASAGAVADYLAATGRPRFHADVFAGLSALDSDRVIDFYGTFLDARRAVPVVLEPDAQPETRPAAAEAAPGALPANPEVIRREIDPSAVVNLAGLGPTEIRRIAPPPRLGALPRFRLKNGLEVVALPRRDAPVTEVTIRLPAGDANMSPSGLASLAVELSRPACWDPDHLLAVGGRHVVAPLRLGRRHRVEVLSGNLGNGLQALSNQLRCRTLLDPLTPAKKRALERAEAASKPVDSGAAAAFWTALYPNRAYAPGRDLAALRAVDADTLEAALRAQYRPGGALAVIVTDRTVDHVREQFATYLERWPQPDRASVAVPPAAPPPGRRSLRLFEGRPGRLAHLQLGCRVPQVTPERWAAYELLEALVRREAWQVRESWGASYGLAVDITVWPRAIAHLTVVGSVDPARAADTVARLLGFLERVGRQGPDIKTFTLERWDLASAFSRRFGTVEGIVQAILGAADLGFAVDMWDRYPESLADLQRASIRDLLVHCPGREAITFRGDVPELTRQLAAHGLAPTP